MSEREIDHKAPKSMTMTFTLRTRDIERFAKQHMGIVLTPQQLFYIDGIIDGKMMLFARRAGLTTARRVLKAYIDADSYIKHFDRTHFTAETIGKRKFVYCPVGNIVSWSEGDYDHKWCHYCHKYFEEIARS